MDIQTKDGILLRGIPDGTPDDVIKARIEKIRAGGRDAAPASSPLPETPQNLRKPEEISAVDKLLIQLPDMPKWKQNVLTGATGVTRGALNLLPYKSDEGKGVGDIMAPAAPGSEGTTGRMIGSLLDPASWAVAGGVGKVLPFVPLMAKGVSGIPLQLGRNVASGATTGGAIGALSDEGSAGTGAGGGAVAGAVLPPAIGGTARVVRALKEAAYPSPGRLGVKAAGDRSNEVINAMLGTQSGVPGVKLTAGQAAVPAGSAEFSALQKLVADKDPSRFYGASGVEGIQDAWLKAHLGDLAKGGTQEASILARRADKKELGKVVGAMMENELSAANIAGRTLPRLQGRAEGLGAAASASVEDVRRLSKAQELADAVAQSGRMRLDAGVPPVAGLPRVSAKYAYGTELSELADRVAQKQADASLILGEGSRFAQRQAESLAAHGLTPIDSSKIISSLSNKLNDPSIGPNEINRRVLTSVGRKIAEWTERGNGVIDAKALHEIRKSAVNNEVEKLLRGADPKAIKDRAAAILSQVKPLIDDAIESAGGTAWKKALEDFSKGAHLIDRTKMGAKAMELFDKSPDELIRLSRGDAPKVVEKIFGPGKVSLSEQMGGTEAPIKRVAAALDRNKQLKDLASAGGKSLEARIGAPEVYPTGTFKPMLSAARGWVNRALGTGHEAALTRLAPIMENPQEMARLMRAATPQQRAVIESMLARRMTQGAIVGGAAQGER